MPKVVFYGHLTRFTGGDREAHVEARDVRETLQSLSSKYGEQLGSKLLGLNGNPGEFVRVFLNNKDVRLLGGADTLVSTTDTLIIVPALAGG
jgi:molybdopterin converting factor small subunit